MNNIPVYYIDINPNDFETGMTTISLVDEPAIERDFIVFDKNKHMNFSADEMEHKISGPAIIADMKIYRYHPEIGEYYIVFTREVIEKIVEKYSKQGFFNMVNLQHDENQYVECAIMTEFYIKDSSKGIVPTGFEDVADGSLFVTYKITNEELWNEIVNGDKLNGFSIEIMGEMKPSAEMLSVSTPNSLDNGAKSLSIEEIVHEMIKSSRFDFAALNEQISQAIQNHYIVMVTYNDDTDEAATGMRQMAVVAYGLSLAGNEVIRTYQYYGDTKTFSPDYKLLRLDRINTFRIVGFVEPWTDDQMDSRYNEVGDEGMLVVFEHA